MRVILRRTTSGRFLTELVPDSIPEARVLSEVFDHVKQEVPHPASYYAEFGESQSIYGVQSPGRTDGRVMVDAADQPPSMTINLFPKR